MRDDLAKPPAAVATSLVADAAWFNQAPTKRKHAATLPAEASATSSGAISVDTSQGAEPMCEAARGVGVATATKDNPCLGPQGEISATSSLSERLSDPARWFQSISPPPPPLPQPAIELAPEQVQRRRVGGALVTLSMALSLLILFAATSLRIRAAMGTEQTRAITSAPAPAATQSPIDSVHSAPALSVTKPQLGGVRSGSAEARKPLRR